MTVTAVLINYQRQKNTHAIIEVLKNQTIPVKIILWNNNDEPFINEKVDWIINSSKNVHAYLLPYLYQMSDTEFILRMDDDLIPTDNNVLEDLIEKHNGTSQILCGHGVRMIKGRNYSRSLHFGVGKYYQDIFEDTKVDIAKGRFLFFRQEYAHLIPFSTKTYHVDLNTSFALSCGNKSYHLIPKILEDRLFELPSKHEDNSGYGYSFQEGHWDKRDKMVEEWLCSLN